MNWYEELLIKNKSWLDLTSVIIVFISGGLALYYKDTYTENPATHKKRLTTFGWVTIPILILSALIQFGLQYVERVKDIKDENIATNRFNTQLNRLDTISNNLGDIQASAQRASEEANILVQNVIKQDHAVQKVNDEKLILAWKRTYNLYDPWEVSGAIAVDGESKERQHGIILQCLQWMNEEVYNPVLVSNDSAYKLWNNYIHLLSDVDNSYSPDLDFDRLKVGDQITTGEFLLRHIYDYWANNDSSFIIYKKRK